MYSESTSERARVRTSVLGVEESAFTGAAVAACTLRVGQRWLDAIKDVLAVIKQFMDQRLEVRTIKSALFPLEGVDNPHFYVNRTIARHRSIN